LRAKRTIRRQNRNRLKSRNSEPSTPELAYLAALRLLNARDYTVARLAEKLGGKGMTAEDVEEAIARLVREGWVNDRRYAERFAESALASGRYYGTRLRQEMRRRGLPPDLVAEVLGELLGGRDETEEVRQMIARRFSGFSFSDATDRDKRRIVGYLQRRGFSLSAILSALKGAAEI